MTDYNFQPTGDAKSSSAAIFPTTKPSGFHKLSSEYFDVEESRHYVAEFSAFTVLGLITAWPIMSMVIAVARLLRN